jgi:hypothetical protein
VTVYLIMRQVWSYDDSYEVRDVVASEDLAETWAEHYRRTDRGAEITIEAWDVEDLAPVLVR